jgi:hypothetical protein
MSFQELLLNYLLYIVITAALVSLGIFAGRFFIRLDKSAQHRMPGFSDLDWASIAFLRGGREALLDVVDFSLAQKGLISVHYYQAPETGGGP